MNTFYRPSLCSMTLGDNFKYLQNVILSPTVCTALLKPTSRVPQSLIEGDVVLRTNLLSSLLERCSDPSFKIHYQLLSKKKIKHCLLSLHPSIPVSFDS